MGIIVRPSTATDTAEVQAMRLEGLQAHPASFNASYEVESGQPEGFWLDRVIQNDASVLFVAELDGALVGMCGVRLGETPKRSHTAEAWGLYARPAGWGRDASGLVLSACVEWAHSVGALLIRCTSNANNLPSIRTCLRCGFRVYGVEPSAIQVEGVYYDDLLMWQPLAEKP